MFDDVKEAMDAAKRKFPQWPVDPQHAMSLIVEEVGELAKAVNQQIYEPEKNPPDAVRTEALHAAAMLMRFLEGLDHYQYKPCSQRVCARASMVDVV